MNAALAVRWALAIVIGATGLAACRAPSRAAGHTAAAAALTPVDPRDTAAYAAAGPEALAAVASCRPPACLPAIFRGPGPGELSVSVDSANGHATAWRVEVAFQSSNEQAVQDSVWHATLDRWAAEKPRRLLLVDGAPRSFAYVRDHVPLSAVWGMREVPAAAAESLSADPAAHNGAIVITTRAHAPPAAGRR